VRRLLLPGIALVAMFVGVVNASGHATATTTLTVEVMGVGTVTSSPDGIKCGNGSKKCYIAYTGTGSVTLTAKPAKSWQDDIWTDDCAGGTGAPCVVPLDGADHIVTANFTNSSGVTQSTLNVTYDDETLTANGGDISAPEKAPPGSAIDCGSNGGGTDCTWTVVTGSTLTLFQTPSTGAISTGWGGACSGTGESCTVEMDGDQNVNDGWVDATDTVQLTVNISGDGHVSGGGISCPSKCVAQVARNTTVTLTADPNDGQVFSGWAGGGCTGTGPTCIVTMDGDNAVTATFTVANTLTVDLVGNGNVSGGSGAINCGTGANICSANFAQNASVTLVASPATGATFVGWTGACGSSATTCTVTMNQSKSVTATFSGGTPPAGGGGTTFSLTVAVIGNGTVTGPGISCGNGQTSCASSNAANSTVTLIATPVGGATFAGWGGGTCSGTASTCTVTFDASKTVTATFSGGTAQFQLSVSVSGPGKVAGSVINCGNGSNTCSATVNQGTSITLTATPAAGAKFAGWGGSCAGTATTCTVSMTQSRSVSATFTSGGTPGTLTITVGGKGTVATSAGACQAVGPSKTCVQHFKAGVSVVLTARPAAGQSFLGWSGACKGTKATCTVKLTTAQTVTANFSAKAGPPPQSAALAPIGAPTVHRTTSGYLVTIRFSTTVGGVATVRGIRAGRTAAKVALRVAPGRARIGPFPVALAGFYDFQVRLAGHTLHMPACLGKCGRFAPPPTFLLVRDAPVVTRTGDAWSVTLHATANQIYDGRIRAFRGSKLLVNQHFLGRATRLVLGPFLLGPGNYTLRLTGVDGYGRHRTLVWVVSLAK
jgi:Divergent InlB B-repeat domain